MDSMYVELSKALANPTASHYITTFMQAGEIMKVIDACYRSAATSKIIQLDYSKTITCNSYTMTIKASGSRRA